MYITCNELHVYTTLCTVSNECSAAKCLVWEMHSLPTLVFQRKNKRGEECLATGLCCACDRARIRLLILADVCSTTAAPAWHLKGTVTMRKQVSLGHSDQGPPSPVLYVAVCHRPREWHAVSRDASPLLPPLISSEALSQLVYQSF